MKNDTQVKVTCLTNEQRRDEIHFDFYDKEGSILGTIVVDEIGRLGWATWNEEYQDYILSTAAYIYTKPLENTFQCVFDAKQPNPIRWERAQEYIDKRGLVVNYQQDRRFNETFKNGNGRK